MLEMAKAINISEVLMLNMIAEIDENGDGNISLDMWCNYILEMQLELKKDNLTDEEIQNLKQDKRKSLMQSIMEDKITEENYLSLDDQVDELMKLQNDNVNI